MFLNYPPPSLLLLRQNKLERLSREYLRGNYHCTVDLLFDWFAISCMTTDNFCFYLQNRLIQTSQTGGQWYSDTSPFSIPWFIHGKNFQPGLIFVGSVSSFFHRDGSYDLYDNFMLLYFQLNQL